VSYDDLIAAGSMAAAKSAGKVRMEGKDYVMGRPADVVEFPLWINVYVEVVNCGVGRRCGHGELDTAATHF